MTAQDADPHAFKVTRTTLSDGRELIYFDDEPAYVSGEKTRKLDDERGLPPAITESELRQDPLTGEWNCYAAHRMNRTFMPPANENPLAPTKPGELPTEIPADDYNVVVFENRFPSLSMHMEPSEDFETSVDGNRLYPRKPAIARCEVVCFTPDVGSSFRDLSFHRARTVVEAWAHRTAELKALPGIRCVFPFENRGKEIGVTLQHPHGQIYSYPYLPPRAAAIATRVRSYRADTGRDLFDDVLAAEKASGKRIISAGQYFTAFVPAAAKWPVEVMLMANRAVGDFSELTNAEKDELTAMYLDLLRRIDKFFPGVDRTPYIAAWNQAPIGRDHCDGRFHLQLYSMMRQAGRMKYLAGSESGMGAWISDTTPELIAQRFKDLGAPRWAIARSDTRLREAAEKLFSQAYGSQAEAVYAAPGRVNLIGEHVDYAGGVCLPFALAHSTAAALKPRTDSKLRIISGLNADAEPVEFDIADIGPGHPANWAGYALGTIWALVEAGVIDSEKAGFDIAVVSDVPIGSGLSSSAALECSVGAGALELGVGTTMDDENQAQLIAAAIRAENDVVGASTGGLDQQISVKGTAGHALALDFAADTATQISADFAARNLEILVINTNVKHALVDGQYASRRGVIDQVAEGLGINAFSGDTAEIDRAVAWAREAVNDEFASTVARRVKHVVSEMSRTRKSIELLGSGDFDEFGKFMNASHVSLRDDYEVSCEELDVVVEISQKAGALGARMTGGGFGGSAIALCTSTQAANIAESVTEAFRLRGWAVPEFLRGHPSPGVRKI